MAEKSSRADVQKDAKSSPSAPNGRDNPPGDSVRKGQRRRLGRPRILRGHEAFSRVMSGGASYSISPLRLFVRISPSSGSPAVVGFAVSRSIRSAARRNRAKRVMREAYRLQQDLWLGSGGLEAVWMYNGDPADPVRYERVRDTMHRLMKKALPPSR